MRLKSQIYNKILNMVLMTLSIFLLFNFVVMHNFIRPSTAARIHWIVPIVGW